MLTADDLKGLTQQAKDLGLSQEQAQALMQQQEQFVQSFTERAQQAMVKQSADWKAEVENDPDIGRDNFPATQAAVQRAMREFATPEFLEELNKSGYGNHPGLVKFVAAIGKRLGEDTDGQGSVASSDLSDGESFYSKANKA